jgi:hypothetical protein
MAAGRINPFGSFETAASQPPQGLAGNESSDSNGTCEGHHREKQKAGFREVGSLLTCLNYFESESQNEVFS